MQYQWYYQLAICVLMFLSFPGYSMRGNSYRPAGSKNKEAGGAVDQW